MSRVDITKINEFRIDMVALIKLVPSGEDSERKTFGCQGKSLISNLDREILGIPWQLEYHTLFILFKQLLA